MNTPLFARWALLLALSLLALSPRTVAQIRPRYTGELIVILSENTAVPAAESKTPADLFATIGAASATPIGTPPSPFALYYIVKLPAAARFGRAFSLVQGFEFGPRWSVRIVEPNYILQGSTGGPIPENGAVRVFNLSMRADVRTGDGAAIGGIVMPGNFAQLVAFRVRGPSLAAFGVSAPLADPVLRLYDGSQLLLQNDNWGTLRDFEKTLARRACPPPEHALDAMLVTYLDPGVNYTAVVSGADGGVGVALVETFIVDEFYNGGGSIDR